MLFSVLRKCNSFFDETSTEEMLKLWRDHLDPQLPSFSQAQVLLCVFLPPHEKTVPLWFSDLFEIWPMFHSPLWDYMWLALYSRVSYFNFLNLDWSPYLPFLFNCLANYMELPQFPLDYDFPSFQDGSIEQYSGFFGDFGVVNDLFPYFSSILVSLLTFPCTLR